MVENALNRIMSGVKTPEGKVIAVLLAICLSLMTWNVAALSFAVSGDDQSDAIAAQEAKQKAAEDKARAAAEEKAREEAKAKAAAEAEAARRAEEARKAEEARRAEEAKKAEQARAEKAQAEAAAAAAAAEEAARAEAAAKDAAKQAESQPAADTASAAGSNGAGAQQQTGSDVPDAETAGQDASQEGELDGAPVTEGDPEAATEGEEGAQDAEGDEEADAEDEKDADEKFPAASFTGSANGVAVSVAAPEGAFPEGTTMHVSKVASAAVVDAVDNAVAGEATTIKAVDISFTNKKGKQVEPKKDIKVSLKAGVIAQAEANAEQEVNVVHLDDRGGVEVVNQQNAGTAANEVAFTSDSFSIYAIVIIGDVVTNQITYEFQNQDGSPYLFNNANGEQVSSQIVKDGESLKPVDMPEIPEGAVFNGWYVYDTASGSWGGKVSFDAPISVTETATVILRPNYDNVAYVTFYENSQGTNILNKVQVVRGSSYTISQTVAAPKADLAFSGWSTQPGTDDDERAVIDNATVTVDDDIAFYPVFKSAHWISFVTGPMGSGATYFAPASVLAGGTAAAAKPADPVWKGHTFEGWATTEDADYEKSGKFTSYNFDGVVKADTTLYAQWTAGKGTYTVVYWKQSVSDDKNASTKTYSFAEQETKTATVGSTVKLSSAASADTGFELNTAKSDAQVTVNADGSSVLNVYYDRKLMTMKFYKNGSSTKAPGSNSSKWDARYVTEFTGLYGQSLSKYGYAWPSGMYTYYYGNGSTKGMSYLGQFVFPDELKNSTEMLFYYSGEANCTIEFYLQSPDGSYPDTASDSGHVSVSTSAGMSTMFYLSDKYDGYTVCQYRRYTGDHEWADSDWVTAASGSQVGLNYSTTEQQWVSNWWGGHYENVTSYGAYNLAVRYQLKTFNVKYLDPVDGTELAGIDAKSARYGQPLTDFAPAAGYAPKSQSPGKEWNGKWYKDQACTEEFDWSATMPNADVNVYAGWDSLWYWVKIDPNGGQLTEGESTYFWAEYGDAVKEYGDVTRNYVEDPAGTYYYHYDEFNTGNPGSAPASRQAYYTEDASASSNGVAYKYEDNAYALIGWYDITNGSATPYSFSAGVRGNTILQAKWRRVGEYRVSYQIDAVDAQGNPLAGDDGARVQVSNVPSDGATYADNSESAILRAPDIPEGYLFQGWRYAGDVYAPGDVFTMDAGLADANKTVYLYPVLATADMLPIQTTQLVYDGNGGTSNGNKTIAISNIQNNASFTLTDQGFARKGYELAGWATDAAATVPEFNLGDKIGVDVASQETNVLFAVWQRAKYDVTVTKQVKGADAARVFAFSYSVDGVARENFALAGKDTTVQTESGAVEVASSKVIKDVPFGSTITISEANEGFATTVNGKAYADSYSYTVTDDPDQTIAFVNTQVKSDITVTKTFTGLTAEQVAGLDGFRIAYDAGAAAGAAQDATGVADAVAAAAEAAGADALTLENGQADEAGLTYTWTIPDVPYGTTLTFAESGYMPDGYYWAGGTTAASVTATGADLTVALQNAYAPKSQLTVSAASSTVTYTGREQSVSGVVVTFDADGEGRTSDTGTFTIGSETYTLTGVSATAAGTDAGEYPNELAGEPRVLDAAGADVTDRFDISTADGMLTIEKAPARIATGSAVQVYTGQALLGSAALLADGADSAAITGLVGDDAATVTATGSVTEVGTAANTYDIDWGATNPDNYQVTEDLGTLTVIANDGTVVLTAPSDSKTYDGTPLTADGTGEKKVQAVGLPDGFTAEATARGAQTDAGTSANVVADYVIRNAEGADRTGSFSKVETVDGQLTVVPKGLTVTTGSAEKPYDGIALTQGDAAVEGLVDGQAVTVEATGAQTQVGSSANAYDIDWGQVNKDNYTVTENLGTLTVTVNATLAITLTAPSRTKTYDGTPLSAAAPDAGETGGVAAANLPAGFTYTAVAVGSQTGAGASASTVASYAIFDAEGVERTSNFANVAKVAGTLTVEPRPITVKTGSAKKEYDGTPLTNGDVTIKGLVEGEAVTAIATGSQTQVGGSANAYRLDWGAVDAANYQVSDELGTLTVGKNESEITLTAPSAEKIYDGVALAADGTDADNPIAVAGLPEGFTVEAAASGSQKDVGEAANVVDGGFVILDADGRDVTANFVNVALVPGTLTVTPRGVTITTGSASKEYDGAPLTCDEATIEGLAAGEDVTLVATGAITEVGDDENAYAINWDNAKRENYVVEEKLGTLTVKPSTAEVVLTAGSASKVYDGTPLTCDTVTAAGLPQGFSAKAQTTGAQTAAGESDNVVADGYAIVDAAGQDKTSNFANVKRAKGTLAVAKRAVTLTSATDSKTYDGNALTAGGITVGGDGFAAGEGATYQVSGSQRAVGTSENAFTYKLAEGTNADNYTITTAFGTLTVLGRDARYQITVKADSATETYDGQEHSAIGFETLDFTVEGNAYTVGGLTTQDPAATDAGTYSNNITGTAVVTDADGNDVTSQFAVFTVNGTLSIGKRSVTLTSASDQKEYDGVVLANAGVEVGGDGFVEGQGATFDVTGSQLTVGSSPNTFAYTLDAGTNADNYAITTKPGMLSVTARAQKFEITLAANSATVTYDGTEQGVSGLVTERFTVNGQPFAVEGATASATGTFAGTYTANVAGPFAVVDAAGNDVTDQFDVKTQPGTLTIGKRALRIAGDSGTAVYTGAEQEIDGYQVDGLAKGDKLDGCAYRAAGVNVGSHSGAFAGASAVLNKQGEDATGSYEISYVPGALTITPASIALTLTGQSDKLTYDGATHELEGIAPAGLLANHRIEGLTYLAAGTVAGEYPGAFSGVAKVYDGNVDVTENYVIAQVPGDLVIKRAGALEVTADSASKIYDGKALAALGFTQTGGMLAAGDALAVQVQGSITNAGSVANVVASAKVMRGDVDVTSSYESVATVPGTLTVGKAPLTVTTGSASKKYDGAALLGAAVMVAEGSTESALVTGLVNGETATAAADGSQTAVGASANTYSINWGATNKDNYDVTSALGTLQVTVTDAEIMLIAPSASKVYDGQELSADGAGDAKVGASGLPAGFTVQATASGSQTDAGSSANVVDDGFAILDGEGTDVTANFTQVTKVDGTLTVTPAPVTVTAESEEFAYDGAAHGNAGFTVEGLVGEDAVSASVTGSITFPTEGAVPNVVGDVSFTAGNPENYAITKVNGVLIMANASQPITITAASQEWTYDGDEHRAPAVAVTEGQLFDGDALVAEGAGAVQNMADTAEGNNPVADGFKVMHGAVDVTANYQVTPVAGTLTINPATITVTANSQTREYDGSPLTNAGYSIKSDDYRNPASIFASVTVAGSQMLVGASSNEVSEYALKTGVDAGNFAIQTVPGVLTVTDRAQKYAIQVVSRSAQATYDGTPKTADGFEELSFGVDGKTYTVEGLSASVTQTGAGAYANAITGAPVVRDADGNDVTTQFAVEQVEGTLSITRRTVVLTSADAEKEYDGNALTNGEVAVSGDGFAEGEGATYEVSGTQTVAGSSANVFTYELAAGTDEANYVITMVPGTLTVKSRTARYDVRVVARSNSATYDGAGYTADGFEALAFDVEGSRYTVEGLQTESPVQTNVGTYTNNVSGTPVVRDAAGNDVTEQFNVELVGGQLTIAPASVTVAVEDKFKVYGDADPDLSASVAGTVGDDQVDFELSRAAGEAAGTYAITAAPAEGAVAVADAEGVAIANTFDQGNYRVTYQPGTLTIAQAPLTVTALSQGYTFNGQPQGEAARVYAVDGETSLEDKVVVVGLKGEDSLTSVKLDGQRTDAGSYPGAISASDAVVGTATSNYAITYIAGDLDIAKATMDLTATGYEGVYDAQQHVATAQSAALGDTVFEYSIDGGATWSEDAPAIVDVGTQAFAVRAVNANYEPARVEGVLSVTPKAVTVTADNQAKTYGDDDPDLTASVAGTLGKDKIAYAVGRVAGENAGTYPITPAGEVRQGNYAVTYHDGTLVIGQAGTLTVAATSYDGVYDAQAHQGGAVPSVAEGTSLSYSVDGGATWSDTLPSITNVGSVTYQVRADNPNYQPALATGTLSVTPAPVTVTADKQAKTYGEDDPALTAQVTGTIGGDEVAFEVARDEGEDVGSYAITPTGKAFQGNYAVSFAASTFTIGKATMALTAAGYEGVYDAEAHAASASPSVAEGTTVEYSTDGGATWSDAAPSITDAGSVAVAVRAVNSNYETATASATLTVAPKPVTVTAQSAGKAYSGNPATDPALASTVDGTLGDDAVVYTTARAAGENVGTYAITPSGQQRQGNYEVSYASAVFTITKADAALIGLSATGYEGTFDNEAHAASASVSVADGTTVEYSVDGGLTWDEKAPSIKDAGSAAVAVRAVNPNYETASAQASLTVAPKAVTVAAQDRAKVYGAEDPALDVVVTGIVEGDDFEIAHTVMRAAGEDVGAYAITPAGTVAQGNYVVTFVPATFEITAADAAKLNLTVRGYDGVFDNAAHEAAAMVDVEDGTTIEYSTDGGSTWTQQAPSIVNVGQQAFQVRATNRNYATATGAATLSVTPAAVTVTAQDAGKVYGTSDPQELAATVEGLVEGDDATISYNVARQPGEDAGVYVITPAGEALQGNYAVTYRNAAFTVSRATTLSVTAHGYSGTYDAAAHAAGAVPSVTAGTVVEYSTDGGDTWSTTAPSIVNVGQQAFQVRATNRNYEDATGEGTLAVAPKTVTVTADAQAKTYGQPDPALTAVVSGAIGGDAIAYELGREPGENVGSYAITPAGAAAQGNYQVTFVPAALAIGKATMALSAQGYAGAYDAAAHGLTVQPGVIAGTTLSYSEDGQLFSPDAPMITDVGERTFTVKASNPNYEDVFATATLKVDPKPVTVTAEAKAKVYGQADPQLTALVDGTLNGDDVAFELIREPGEDVGSYAITPAGEELQGNYAVSYYANDLTIAAAEGEALALTAQNYHGVYDGKAHLGGYTLGVAPGTVISYSIDGGDTWSAEMPSVRDAGSVSYLVRAENPNYQTATAEGALTVDPKAVVVKADDASKVYGADDPTLTAQVTGLVGEEPESLISFTVDRAPGEDVAGGPYAITPAGEELQGNYAVTYEAGALAIRKATMSVAATGYAGVYDAQPHAASAEPDVADGTTVEYSADGGATWSAEPPAAAAVGARTVQVRATNPNYEDAFATATLTVDPKPVTVTAQDAGKTYGQADPDAYEAVVSGVLGDDVVAYAVSREAGEDVGAYAVTPAGEARQGNYLVAFIPGTFTISKAAGEGLGLAVAGYSGTFDGQEHAVSVQATVAAGTSFAYSVDGGQTWSAQAPSLRDVGALDVVVKALNPNYEDATAQVQLAIGRAPVTVKVLNAGKAFDGDASTDPALGASVTGVVPGDDFAVAYTLTREEGQDAGPYAITFVDPQAEQGNYQVEFVDGTFTITPADARQLNLTAIGYAGVFDNAAHAAGFSVDVAEGTTIEFSTDGGSTWSTEAPVVRDVGERAFTVRAINPNYEQATDGDVLTVTPKAATVRAASAGKVYGTSDPELRATVSGIVAGDDFAPAYEVTREDAEDVGEYGITAAPTGDYAAAGADGVASQGGVSAQSASSNVFAQGNYLVTYLPATFTITPAAMTLAAQGYEGVYDGQPHALHVQVSQTDALVEYSVDGGMTWTAIAPQVTGAESCDVAIRATKANYDSATAQATLVVTPRAVSLASNDAQKAYDGEALTDTDVRIAGDGFVVGEVSDVKAVGSIALVGEAPNQISFVKGAAFDEANYEIAYELGTLRVTDGADGEPVDPADVVWKTAGKRVYELGDTVTYTVRATNIYDEPKTITLVELPGVQLAQSVFEDVAPGQTVATTATYTITEGDVNVGAFTNRVEAQFVGGKTFGNTVDVDTQTPDSVLLVDKQVLNPQDEYAIGDVIRYAITVTNGRNAEVTDVVVEDRLSDAAGQVQFTDLAGGEADGAVVTFASLGAGESKTLYAEYQVQAGDAGKRIHNAAVASSSNLPGAPEATGEVESGPVESLYTLTVRYLHADGSAAADTHVEELTAGAAYDVASPAIEGYKANYGSVRGAMPARDLTVDVVYAKLADVATTAATRSPAPGTPAGGTPTGPVGSTAAATSAAVAAVTTPAPAATVTIDDDGNPLASIVDETVPLASSQPEGAWSLVDLLCTALIAVLGVIMLIGMFGKRREDGDGDDGAGASVGVAPSSCTFAASGNGPIDATSAGIAVRHRAVAGEAVEENGNQDDATIRRKRPLRAVGVVLAVASVVLLLVVEDFTQPMALFDIWTPLFAVMAIAQVIISFLTRKKTDDPDQDREDDPGQDQQEGALQQSPSYA